MSDFFRDFHAEATLTMLAVLVAVISFAANYFFTPWSKKRDLTIDIWKSWISSDYRRFRLRASLAIKKGFEHSDTPEGQIDYADLAKDFDTELAIGSIQHMIIDMAAVYKRGMIEKELFDSLFKSTILEWNKEFSIVYWIDSKSKPITTELNRAFSDLLDNEALFCVGRTHVSNL